MRPREREGEREKGREREGEGERAKERTRESADDQSMYVRMHVCMYDLACTSVHVRVHRNNGGVELCKERTCQFVQCVCVYVRLCENDGSVGMRRWQLVVFVAASHADALRESFSSLHSFIFLTSLFHFLHFTLSFS